MRGYQPVRGSEEIETSSEKSSRDSDIEHSRQHSSWTRARNNQQRIVDIITTALFVICALSSFQYIFHISTFSPERVRQNIIDSHYSEAARSNPKYHCGNSSAEARSLGCVFDLSLVGWVPEPCFDAELNQRFMDWGWRFFEDQNGTIEASLERIIESAGTREPFWAQHGYHITHCELAWERMHRALKGGKPLTTHLLNLHHTKHCGMMNELRDDFYSLNSQILPLLNTC